MQIDDVAKVVEVSRTMMPLEVLKCLGDVEILVCADVVQAMETVRAEFDEDPFTDEPGGVMPADAKAMFVGEQMNVEEEDDETEVIEYPAGVIVLVASNLTTEEEVHIAFLHEVGHALDFDEDEVRSLGLSGMEAPDASKGKQATG